MKMLADFIAWLRGYRSGRYSTGGIINTRIDILADRIDADEMLQEWRLAFGNSLLDSFERSLINPTRSFSSGTAKDMRLIQNFVEHAIKELPRGSICRIMPLARAVEVTYPQRVGEEKPSRWAVTYAMIEDAGIVCTLNALKSVTGEYLGNPAQKPKLTKSLRQNTVLPASRRLRLGRAKNAARGES